LPVHDSFLSESTASGGTSRRAALWTRLGARGLRPFWVTAAAVLLVQLVALGAYSAWLWHRFDLTDDFASYTQAWWLIGHGHLNPVDTIHSPTFAFVKNHFELGLWPIGWLGRLWPNGLLLLWLQDLALVATEAVVLLWVVGAVAERVSRHRTGVALAALVALVGNIYWYETASFDVHGETLGLPFAVAAAYALWQGRSRAAWIAALIALCFGDVVALTLLFAGLGVLVASRWRRSVSTAAALGVTVLAVVWFALVTVLDANQGSGVVSNYGYLVHAGSHATARSVLSGLASHPLHVLHVAVDRWRSLGKSLTSAGLLGLLTPVGFLVAVGTLVPAALNVNPAFVTPTIAFQTLAVVPFVFVGSVALLLHLGGGVRPVAGGATIAPTVAPRASRRTTTNARWRAPVAWVLGAALFALALTQSVTLYSQIRSDWWKVDAPAAGVLSRALTEIPSRAEVISSQGVIGRFAERVSIYPDVAAPQAFPIRQSTVVFVIAPSQGIESVPVASARADIAYIRHQLGATVLVSGHGVTALEWHPPAETKVVVLP
jgi:uncharacterized membrane protein